MKASILFTCVLIILTVFSTSAQPREEPKKQLPVGTEWQLQSFTTDKRYGAEVWKAYDYLKGRTSKAKTIVAIIDGGADVEHEDLKGSLWVNRGEIPGNGIDDDGNGYIDDVHGWNFAGYADGRQLTIGSLEVDREYVAMCKKFENVDTSRLSKKAYREYRYFKDEIEPHSTIRQSQLYIAEAKVTEKYMEQFDKEIHEKYPKNKFHLLRHFGGIMDDNETDPDRVRACNYLVVLWRKDPMGNWQQFYKKRHELVKEAQQNYEKNLANVIASKKARAELGDDQSNWKDGKYGNNNLFEKESSLHGMHVGGIVGATRGNGVGIDGIADVELMFIRLSEGNGDERDKNVASAVRYAVDNGARVINMSFGKAISPNKKVVDKALLYAEKKGVLLVHAAGNDGKSIEERTLYPSKHITAKRVLKNWISVGSIGSGGYPALSSNYGKTEVDLFAPGDGINSCVPGGYLNLRGTSMAAPVVTGVIALIWNYFPELNAAEVKRAVLEGVSSRKGVEVTRPTLNSKNRKVVNFDELCVTGGVVSALGAVKVAEKIYMEKSK